MTARSCLTAAVGALLCLAVVGCGATEVVVDSPVTDPYDGPMRVQRDHSDDATVTGRSGAAGLALECAGEPYDGGGGDYADGGLERVQSSPDEAFEDFRQGSWVRLPAELLVERVEDERVLLSYDVGGRTKVAVVTADGLTDWDDDTGWGVESWAMCDPAELPAQEAEALGFTVWQDADGHPVPVTTVTSAPGPEHCDWTDIVFLSIGGADHRARELYLRDVDAELRDSLRTTYSDDAPLPPDAWATGWHHDGRELWLVPDRTAAYLVAVDDPTDAERWPGTVEPVACA